MYKFINKFETGKKIKINFFLKFFLFFLRFLIFLLFLLFSKIFKFKILNSSFEALGHQVCDIECFILDYNHLSFRPIILLNKKYLANVYFFENFQLPRIKEKNIKPIIVKNNYLCFVLYFLKSFKSISISLLEYNSVRGEAKVFEKFNKINLYNNLNTFLPIKINNFDINREFVLIHSRDNSLKPNDGERYRDSEIDDLEKLVDYILSKSLQVVRFGNFGMKKCKFEKKIIDLTTFDLDKYTKNIIDVFFASNCKYFVGCSSGAYALPSIFGKSCLTVNTSPLSTIFPVGYGLTIPKLYRNIQEKKILNFKEIISYKYDELRYDKEFLEHKLELLNNSPEEILNGFKDLEKYPKQGLGYIANENQKKFKSLFKLTSIIDKKYSLKSQGHIAQSFIEKYRSLL